MQVILKEEVPSLGQIGDVVRVRDGYARNYLLPRGLAVRADQRNLKALEHQKRVLAEKKLREQKKLKSLAEKLEQVRIRIAAKAGEEGKLFGSVTSQDIEKELAEKGFQIERKRILLEQPIKHLGEHTVSISLGHQTKASVRVEVVREGEETQAESGAEAEPAS